ncbi:MAG: monovalent cation/H+ antiporter subunit D [Pseudomonadota bacterium]
MTHWIILPIVVPALTAALIVLLARQDLILQRFLSILSALAVFVIAAGLVVQATGNPPYSYELGNWPAPFGIVLVLDRLSAAMVLVTMLLVLAVLIYSLAGWDKRGRHFHALFQFQIMGINGAFLTGDLFNLFVFFEVLLIASYGLMLHGSGATRLKAGMQYVVVNLMGSSLFLVAMALLYGVTGTLNMADLALRVGQVESGNLALVQVGALLLLMVFAIKAALVPLHFWLPATYAAAAAPVAALFAIMTKVGGYSILRVYTLIFGEHAGDIAWIAQDWIMPAALVTLVVGMFGVMAGRSLRDLICFSVIGSMGTLMVAFALFNETAVSAGLYYMVHSTFIAGALFLVAEMVINGRSDGQDTLAFGLPLHREVLLSGLFFLAAIGMVGMPPLSGFVGKLLILDGATGTPYVAWIWIVILSTSLFNIIGFSRAGSILFWKSQAEAAAQSGPSVPMESVSRKDKGHGPESGLGISSAAFLLGLIGLLTAFSGPVSQYFDTTAAQLLDGRPYIEAVLGSDALAESRFGSPSEDAGMEDGLGEEGDMQ